MSDIQDKDFLETIVKAIVGHPDKVEVDRTVDEMGVLLTLKTDPEDMGYVIGRRGQTAQAIRTLLKIVGAKNNARVNLKIYEPEGSIKPPRREREPREGGRDNRGDNRNKRDEQEHAPADIDTSVIDDLDSLTI